MNQLSLIGQLNNLSEQRVVQPLDQSHHFAQYLQARSIEARRRYVEAVRDGPLNQKQISVKLGVTNVRTTLRRLEKEGYLCDAAPGQKRKKQLKLWKWTGKEVE